MGLKKNIPWYDDLFLDVIMQCPTITEMGYYIQLADEIEFKAARNEGVIDEDTYHMGYTIAIDLMQELREQNNDIVNRCQFDLYRIKSLLGL